VSLEHLLTELFVATGFDGVELETVGVGVYIMVLGEQVRNWVESGNDCQHHANDDLLIWSFVLA